MSKVSLFFLVFLIAEIAVLAKLVSSVGFLGVLLWLILMVFVGVQMISLFLRRMKAAESGIVSLFAFRYLFAGILFIFPGVISDVIGILLLLIPGVRDFIFNRLNYSFISNRQVYKDRFMSKFFDSYTSYTNGGAGMSNDQSEQANHYNPYNQYGQPNRPEQPKSDLQRAKEHFQSKRPVIDADYESVPENQDEQSNNSNNSSK